MDVKVKAPLKIFCQFMILVGESVNEFECAGHWNSLPASSVLDLGTLIHNDAQHRCFIYWVCLPIPHPYGHTDFLTQAPKSHVHFPTALSCSISLLSLKI